MRHGRSGTVRRAALLLAAVALFLAWGPGAGPRLAWGEERATFEGKVVDTKGVPVEGALVFIYTTPDVRRTANFISNRTAGDGRYRVVLPAGSYWAVARLKHGETYGPLMPGDKHSGDPVEVEFAPGKTVHQDFTVADLQEAIRTRTKDRERAFRVTGRIVDEGGTPVAGAYAIANKTARLIGIPDYLSAWADDGGRFTLYLPRGKYYLGAASIFPPGRDVPLQGTLTVEGDRQGVEIMVKTPKGP